VSKDLIIMTQQLSWLDSPSEKAIEWHLYIDGAARGNPGPAGVGIYITKHKKSMLREGFFIGECTNNQAEYTALLLGICRLHIYLDQHDIVCIFSDSQLLVRQIEKVYQVKNPVLQKLNQRAHELLKAMNYIVRHISRSENSIADALANDGIDQARPIPRDLLQACGVTTTGLPCE